MKRSHKKEQPNCLLIPGFGESPADKQYRIIRKSLEDAGWNVVPVRIKWERTTLTSWLEQTRSVAKKHPHLDTLFGFSFGALIALVLKAELRPRTVIAASPSPYFREQLKLLPPLAEKMLGKKRMADFKNYPIAIVTHGPRVRVRIIVGEVDFPLLISESRKLKTLMGGAATHTLVPKAPHDLGDPNYLDACKKIIQQEKKNRTA